MGGIFCLHGGCSKIIAEEPSGFQEKVESTKQSDRKILVVHIHKLYTYILAPTRGSAWLVPTRIKSGLPIIPSHKLCIFQVST